METWQIGHRINRAWSAAALILVTAIGQAQAKPTPLPQTVGRNQAAQVQEAEGNAPQQDTGSILDRKSSGAIPDPQAETLVAGAEPLTRQMTENCTNFLEWVLDAPMTQEQRDTLRQGLINAWKSGREADRDGVRQMLGVREQVLALSPEQRDLLRAKVQPQMLEAFRRQTGDETVRWILAIYETAHRPIASGSPPLTRQMTDAYAEALAFMAQEVTGKPAAADRKLKDTVAAMLAGGYSKMTPEQRKQIGQIPLYWAAIRVAWPNLSAGEKDTLREQWRGVLQAMTLATPEQQAMNQALARIKTLVDKSKQQPLTRAELKACAEDMDRVAAELRRQGGEANLSEAVQVAQVANRYRQAANAPANPPASAASNRSKSEAAYQEAMQRLQSQHSAFMGGFNANVISYTGSMNAIAIMSGSPYRYSYH